MNGKIKEALVAAHIRIGCREIPGSSPKNCFLCAALAEPEEPKRVGAAPQSHRCDAYSLAFPELRGVTFCRKGGARVVGEVYQDLKAIVSQLRDERQAHHEDVAGLLQPLRLVALDRGFMLRGQESLQEMVAQTIEHYSKKLAIPTPLPPVSNVCRDCGNPPASDPSDDPNKVWSRESQAWEPCPTCTPKAKRLEDEFVCTCSPRENHPGSNVCTKCGCP